MSGGRQEVRVTRHRDALEGQTLRVLGRLRRHGGTELLVVLPDGSKRMIPAEWTDAAPAGGGDGRDAAATLGAISDLLAACVLVRGLSARGTGQQGPGCTAVTGQGGQPCSLCSSVCCRRRFRHHPG